MKETNRILFDTYHGALIDTAEQKLARPLTDNEKLGIKNIYSFLMLEAIEMTLIYESVEKVEDMIRYHADQYIKYQTAEIEPVC